MFRTILVPIDTAETSVTEFAVYLATQFAALTDGAVRMIHVFREIPHSIRAFLSSHISAERENTADSQLHEMAVKANVPAGRFSYTSGLESYTTRFSLKRKRGALISLSLGRIVHRWARILSDLTPRKLCGARTARSETVSLLRSPTKADTTLTASSRDLIRAHPWTTAGILAGIVDSVQWGGSRNAMGAPSIGWVSPVIVSMSSVLSGVLLLIAGIFQFSPLKHTCLRACRSPLGFLISDWRDGLWGAWHMGIRHGLYCLGCCWALMALLFVGGVMNLLWIAALAGLVAIEEGRGGRTGIRRRLDWRGCREIGLGFAVQRTRVQRAE
jgi:hypothetical protein